MADRGYRGDLRCCTPYDAKNRYHLRAMGVARARHETVNRCLKRWGALKHCFRHHRSKHQIVFRAVVVCTQLAFNNGYKPFQLVDWDYEDPIFGYPHPSGGQPFANNTHPIPREEIRTVSWAPVVAVLVG